jgi:rRNA processing protein Krr1/Pno1
MPGDETLRAIQRLASAHVSVLFEYITVIGAAHNAKYCYVLDMRDISVSGA